MPAAFRGAIAAGTRATRRSPGKVSLTTPIFIGGRCKYRRVDRAAEGSCQRKARPLELARRPEKILSEAVRRMLPKNKLASKMLDKLKIYAGGEHPHQAQAPEPKELGIK